MIRSIGLLLCVLALRRSPARAPGLRSDRVIVLGLDGVDPQVVDLLMSEGKLPNFAQLRQEGAYGRLESSKPLLSPDHLDDDRHRQDARSSTASPTSSP